MTEIMMVKIRKNTGNLSQWWLPLALAEDESLKYSIGTLTLYLQRKEQEWIIASERLTESEDLFAVSQRKITELPAALRTHRYVFQKNPEQFRLKPVLLDRTVVIKTRQPVNIPPAEKMTFYISSPVAVQIELIGVSSMLQEIPTLRLSDTWVGSSTLNGELCYATKTLARHSLDDIPLRPHRAVTPVTIQNKSSVMLNIEKLNIPVPLLSVFGAENGTLWTESISLQHEGEHTLARLSIDKKLPQDLTVKNLLSSPRTSLERNGLIRAFNGIFHND